MEQAKVVPQTPAMRAIKKQVDEVDDQIDALKDQREDLIKDWQKHREQNNDLVPYETMIQEIPQGSGKPRRGQFLKFYSSFYNDSTWITVLKVKKDGEVGVQTATFYNWVKE